MGTDPARKQSLTESELLFEEYLTTHDYTDFWRIPESAEKEPDYGVHFRGLKTVFEVKEFDGNPPAMGFGTFDAYGPVRRKLHKSAEKFRRYKDRPCCAVLFNGSPQLVMLDWQHVAGAMLGNLGFSVPLGGPASAITPRFLDGGKVVYKGEPINTTISATVVVRKGVFARRHMMIEADRTQAKLERPLSEEEWGEILERARAVEKPSIMW